jgi:hypothetical protein
VIVVACLWLHGPCIILLLVAACVGVSIHCHEELNVCWFVHLRPQHLSVSSVAAWARISYLQVSLPQLSLLESALAVTPRVEVFILQRSGNRPAGNVFEVGRSLAIA